MQRTSAIYGLAASTFIGAFFLVARPPPKPADDEQQPIEPAAPPPGINPITELIFSDGTLEVTARVDRGLVMTGGTEPVWMDVGIKASGVAVRSPLTAVLVMDRSGSMAGEKIAAARMAAERFILGLREGDALGLVSFGTDVSVDLPITPLDAGARDRALAVVRHLEEGGGTNIDGALQAARRLIDSTDRSGRVARVIFVSDGRPTEGDRREHVLAQHAAALRNDDVSSSTLGLGLDYNEDLMERIAVEGGGRFHHLHSGEQLAKILDEEFQHAAAVVASDVRLFLPSNMTAMSFIDAPGSRTTHGERIAVDVGDLAVGEERRVLIKLAPGDARQWDLVAPEVTYRKAVTNTDALVAHRSAMFRLHSTSEAAALEQSRRDDVRVRVLQVEASLALTESMQAWAAGDASRAREQLAQKKIELERVARTTRNASIAAEAANFNVVLDAVQAAPAPSSAASQEMVKAQKARAFQLRR